MFMHCFLVSFHSYCLILPVLCDYVVISTDCVIYYCGQILYPMVPCGTLCGLTKYELRSEALKENCSIMHTILTILRLPIIIYIKSFCRSNKHVNDGKTQTTNTLHSTCVLPRHHAHWQAWITHKSPRFAR